MTRNIFEKSEDNKDRYVGRLSVKLVANNSSGQRYECTLADAGNKVLGTYFQVVTAPQATKPDVASVMMSFADDLAHSAEVSGKSLFNDKSRAWAANYRQELRIASCEVELADTGLGL